MLNYISKTNSARITICRVKTDNRVQLDFVTQALQVSVIIYAPLWRFGVHEKSAYGGVIFYENQAEQIGTKVMLSCHFAPNAALCTRQATKQEFILI